jgi:hypothetical protein
MLVTKKDGLTLDRIRAFIESIHGPEKAAEFIRQQEAYRQAFRQRVAEMLEADEKAVEDKPPREGGT